MKDCISTWFLAIPFLPYVPFWCFQGDTKGKDRKNLANKETKWSWLEKLKKNKNFELNLWDVINFSV